MTNMNKRTIAVAPVLELPPPPPSEAAAVILNSSRLTRRQNALNGNTKFYDKAKAKGMKTYICTYKGFHTYT